MNIGIIVYSLSGHSLSVASELKDKLSASGHSVVMVRIETVGPASAANEQADLKTKPAVEKYDTLVFGFPVRGGAIPPPMMNYLEGTPSLRNKKVHSFVTHFFRKEWGANQTNAALKAICKSKGAQICYMGEINWFSLNRRKLVIQVIDQIKESITKC
jgi:flavodoxin